MSSEPLTWDVPLQEHDLTSIMPAVSEKSFSRIGRGMAFEGAFFTATGCDIAGSVKGHVSALPASTAPVRTQPGSNVCGEIHSPQVSVNGHFDGLVNNPVGVTVVGSSAAVKGVIRYRILRSDGALLDTNLIKVDNAPGGAAP